MKKEQQSLADFVRRIRADRRFSLTDVHLQSGSAPEDRIAKSHISRIENGIATNPTSDTLNALARGLKLTKEEEEELFRIARGKTRVTEDDLADDEEVAALFYRYKNLTPKVKKELRRLIKILDREIDELEGKT